MRFFTVAWFVIWLACLVFLLASNSWLATFLYAYSLYVIIGIGHNYSHKNSQWGKVMDLTAYPLHIWQGSHCFSHHTYANLERDIEIIAFEPLIYFLSSQPQNSKITILAQIFVLLFSPVGAIVGLVDIITGAEKFRASIIAIPAQFLLAFLFNGGDGLLKMTAAHVINGVLFMALSFPSHRSQGVWTEGDPNPTRDYAIHTIQTTADHSKGMSFLGSMLLFQGFTDHVGHHLFPTADHSKMPLIKPFILEACREMNLEHMYPTHSFVKLFIGYFPFLMRKRPGN